MRIGFLFNHDQIHQVAHSLPIALAMADSGIDAEIILATTNERMRSEVVRLAAPAIGRTVSLHELRLRSPVRRAAARFAGSIAPAAKLLIYADNLDFFRSLDLLVVAEKTSLVLKERYGLKDLRIVHTRHGAGDRAIGFNRASAGFDHVLVSGPKIRRRLIDEAGLDPAKLSVVGYPKFDLRGRERCTLAMIDDRPLVLYNPHVSPHLSSWFRVGRRVLDWFVEHDEYQLLFAPHVMLFERPFAVTIDKLRIDRPGRIPERYLRAPNIHFDLGSRASTTMAYTDRADIYLGDVSSQVYEFLIKPRPCLFLNAHDVAWQGKPDFAHWQAGRVLDDVGDLGVALAGAGQEHVAHYRAVQQRLFSDSFDLTATPSSVRAAWVIAKFAGLTPLRAAA
jgi:hypothetical protein